MAAASDTKIETFCEEKSLLRNIMKVVLGDGKDAPKLFCRVINSLCQMS